MIDYIKGKLVEKKESGVVVEVEYMAYFIHTYFPLEEFTVGENIKIYTRLIVREDDISIYGFLTKDSRMMFDLLKTVSGVGPRVAGGILANIRISEIRKAILCEDAKLLTTAPGIGKKTAERIILELKDKVSKCIFEEVDSALELVVSKSEKQDSPALEALLSLGYNEYEVEQVLERIDQSQDISVIIREALKMMGR